MDPALIALIVAFITPIVTYLITARQFSGKIETSAAKDLWSESSDIRRWSLERIRELNQTVTHLEERVSVLEAEKGTLQTKLNKCESRLMEFEREAFE